MVTLEIFFELILFLGTGIIWSSFFKKLWKGEFGIDIIAGIALLSTFFAKEYLAGVVVLIMYSGGQLLEEYAMRRAKKELSLLISSTPTKAHLQKGETFVETDLREINPGDIVLIKPKEIISVDGIVVEGDSFSNEAVLTGESEPVKKERNSLVFAGTENISNPLIVRVLKFANETKYNEIVELVKNNENHKAKIVRLADKYSIHFTILTFLVASLTWFLTENFTRVIAVLVVATPCPLLIATPVAIMSGMSRAYKKGVVMKTGASLETLSKITSFVFDKTGTITIGAPAVTRVVSLGKITENEILQVANSLDQFSTHIYANALKNYFGNNSLNEKVENFHEDFGLGVSGKIKGKEYLLGQKYFLESRNINFQKANLKELEEKNSSQNIVFLSDEKEILGAILFEDEVRAESKNVFTKFLENKKINISILTGDNKEKADKIASILSIKNVVANSSPKDKLDYIKNLQKTNLVAMVGDGINDAPALTQADIGIAMATRGKTTASEVADLVILSNDLMAVYDAFYISRRTVYLAKQSIFIGIGASLVAMVFSSLGYISPLVGAVLQEVIDIIVILNALRVK